jgi:hypothetical protein
MKKTNDVATSVLTTLGVFTFLAVAVYAPVLLTARGLIA